jgi:Cu2+-exporting ATPase
VVFDKTGTLTRGEVRLLSVRTLGDREENQCRAIAAALERYSEHPLARAFDMPASRQAALTDIRVLPGAGIEGFMAGRCFRLGSRQFTTGVAVESGDAPIVLSEAGIAIAEFVVADPVRAEVRQVIGELRALDLRSAIASGDGLGPVRLAARECGIEAYTARCTPEMKLAYVRELMRGGESVCVVGDGINDAPVLGGASVSIAMGRGSALAHASADCVLVGLSLHALPIAIAHARRTQAVVRANLRWSAGYNLMAIPLAALGLIPPWAAAIGMSLSSMLVVANSLRLSRLPDRAAPIGAKPSFMLTAD